MADQQSPARISFIGTGPISLLKAYIMAKRYPESQVDIFDMRGEFGGAWYSDKSPKGHEIECGCHIWSYNPKVYQYIENELGVPLDYFQPRPLFIGKSFKVPYSTKNFVDSYKFIGKNLLLFRAGNIKNRPNIHWKVFGKRNKYPKTGSPELINALKKKLSELNNVEIIKGVTIKQIKLGDQINLIGEDKTYVSDQVFMTSVSKLDQVSKGETVIPLDPERIDYNHFLIRINKPLKKKISYWRLLDDPVIHRITDISYQTKGEELLLLVGIKPKAFNEQEEESLMDHIKNEMKSLKLLDDSFEMELIKSHCYPTYYSDGEARDKIAELDDRLTVLHSTDLIYGMYYMLKEENLI